jgi:PEP-CTERM motif
MKLSLIQAAIVAAAIAASAAANAQTFDFSYTFADGQELTGSLTGLTTNGGQSVTDISNIQAALNGIAFAPVTENGTTFGNATLQANAWNSTLAAFDDTTPVTIYANGALNDFIFSDVDASTSTTPDYEFAYINDGANGIYQAVAANFLQSDSFSTAEGSATQLALDSPGIASSWKLSEVSPVPIPDTLPLLVSGLGLLGFGARRRRAA